LGQAIVFVLNEMKKFDQAVSRAGPVLEKRINFSKSSLLDPPPLRVTDNGASTGLFLLSCFFHRLGDFLFQGPYLDFIGLNFDEFFVKMMADALLNVAR